MWEVPEAGAKHGVTTIPYQLPQLQTPPCLHPPPIMPHNIISLNTTFNVSYGIHVEDNTRVTRHHRMLTHNVGCMAEILCVKRGVPLKLNKTQKTKTPKQ